MTAYFRRVSETSFLPSTHVGGAWDATQQHVAPALGLMVHEVERLGLPLMVSRLSFDILGVLPLDEVTVSTSVVRPGRTISLVEATLSHAGRPAVLLRAWLLAPSPTDAGTDLAPLPPPSSMPPWDPTTVWPGGFIASASVRRELLAPGRGRYWVRTDTPLLEDEPVSPLATAAGLLDIANGMVVRASPTDVAYPNVDLTAHLVRTPRPGWLGFDTTVSFGPSGLGLTSSVLHDEHGPLGTLAQTLTVRPVESGVLPVESGVLPR
jgi:hypothetical protein